MTVEQAIAHRESRRKFSAAPLGLDELAFLLWATQGVRAPGPVRSRRTVPSAGCRHACETWLYIDRVEGLEPGLYRYLPLGHQLVLQRSWQEDMPVELDKALLEQYWQAPAYFIWTAVPYRMEWRYTTASAKLIAIDVGHVCQNLYLACESIGCGTCGIGAYDQTAMDAFLGVDGEEEFALYMAPGGKLA